MICTGDIFTIICHDSILFAYNKMKDLFPVFISSVVLGVPVFLPDAIAFEGTAASCSKMASLAQKTAAQNNPSTLRYSFTGFTGYARVAYEGSDAQEWYCDGYITETSPKGKLVCTGHIVLKAKPFYLSWDEGTYAQKQFLLNRLNREVSGSTLARRFQSQLDAIEAERLGGNSNCRWQ